MPDSTEYGYVNFYTPYQGADDAVAGRWQFRMAETVTDFATAWQAAVDDFANDPEPWRDAKVAGHTLNYGDLLDYPHILARHGLTFVPDPAGDEVGQVDHDDTLVDPEEEYDRCGYVNEDGEICGRRRGYREGGPADRCGTHDA